MKKIILLSTSLLVLALVAFYSCKKESNICSDCGEAPFIPTKGDILNHSFTFNHYSSVDEGNFFQTHVSKSNFDDIVSKMGIESFTKPNQSNSILIAYLYKSYDTAFDLDVKSIAGFLMYYFENDKLYTKVLKVVGDKIVEDYYYSTSTDRVGLRDIYEVGYFAISDKIKTAIFIGNKGEGRSFVKTNLPILRYKLKLKSKIFAGNNLKAEGGKRCPSAYNGCPSGQKGACQTKDNAGNSGWYCTGNSGGDDCLIVNVGGGLGDALLSGALSVLSVDYSAVTNTLYQFEGNYLANSQKGLTFIVKHYDLSNRLLGENELNYSFSVPQLVYIATTLSEDFVPVVNQLLTDPNSTSVLYNTSTRDELVGFFNFLKDLYPDQASKNTIDGIISDININCNKTVAEVHLFFNS